MPGLTIISDEEASDPEGVLDSCLDAGVLDDRYQAFVYDPSGSGPIAVGAAVYEDYPLSVHDIDGYTVVFEGEIYDVNGRNAIREKVDAVFNGVLGQRSDPVDAFCRWLKDRDGEFVIAIIGDDSEEAIVITDALGRLPLYRAEQCDRTVVSRDYGVVAKAFDGEPEYDRLGIAQFLTFGYSLGERTMLSYVNSVPPATAVHVGSGGIDTRNYRPFRFDLKYADGRSIEANAETLARLFRQSIRRRASDSLPNVISLSGGLDSRAILAAFEAESLHCETATMDHEVVAAADVERASELSHLFGREWNRYDLDARKASDFARLMQCKNGRDSLTVAHLIRFFDRLVADYGALTYLAGDGGDKLLPDLRPPRSLDGLSMPAVADYILRTESRIDPEDAAKTARIRPHRLHRSVIDRLESYHAADNDQRYVEFLFRERVHNCLFEAEDTNRCYFWSPAPFYSLPFVEYARGIPDAQKTDYRLFGAFLNSLSPKATMVENANYSARPGSIEHRLKAKSFGAVQRYPALLDRVLPIVKRSIGLHSSPEPEAIDRRVIREQLLRSQNSSVLEPAGVDTVLSDGYSRRNAYLLMTVTAFIDDLDNDLPALEQSPEIAFDGRGDPPPMN